MKLQRNNKYAKKITIGLGALIVSLGILTGCNNNKDEAVMPTETSIVTEKSIVDDDYFSNYYNISDEEISNRINRLSIKYPGSGFERGNVGTMVLKDKNGNFKILMLNLSRNEKDGITTIREMFTNEKLCDIKTTDLGTLTDKYGKRITANLNALTDISEYLSDYEIYELGDFSYSTNFLEAHFDDVKAQYNLNNDNYSISSNVVDYNKMTYVIESVANNYVTNVADIFQLYGSDLGISTTADSYSLEEKYIAETKITEEEILRRTQLLGIDDANKSCSLLNVSTLLLKDINGNYKVSQVYNEYIMNGNNVIGFKIYDLFTSSYLCELDIRTFDFKQDYEGLYINADLSKFSKFSDILENYEIVEYGRWDYIFGVVSNHIKEFRERDGVDYEAPHMYFEAYPNGIDFDNMYLISDIARNYVKYIPQEMQMYAKDYQINSSNKVLTKN